MEEAIGATLRVAIPDPFLPKTWRCVVFLVSHEFLAHAHPVRVMYDFQCHGEEKNIEPSLVDLRDERSQILAPKSKIFIFYNHIYVVVARNIILIMFVKS